MDGQGAITYPIEREKKDPRYTLERVIDVLRETNYVGDPPRGWENIYGNVMLQPPDDATFKQIVDVVKVITEVTRIEGGRDMSISCGGDLVWYHMTPEEGDRAENALRELIGEDALYDEWAFVYDDDFPENYRRTTRHRMRVLLAEHPRSEGRVVRRGRDRHVRGLFPPSRGRFGRRRLLTIPIEPVGKPLTSFYPAFTPEKEDQVHPSAILQRIYEADSVIRYNVF